MMSRSIYWQKAINFAVIFVAVQSLSVLNVVSASAATEPEQAEFQLEQNNGGIELVVTFSEPVTAEMLSRIAIELDGIDVTAVAILTPDGQIRIQPLGDTYVGAHQLIVHLISADGSDFKSVGEWSFDIEGEAGTDGEQGFVQNYAITARHELIRTIQEENDVTTGQSAGQVAVQGSAGDWQMDGQINYLAATEREARLTENGFDIGEYSLNFNRQTEQANISGNIGHQTFHSENLLITQLNRRGLGVNLSGNEDLWNAKAFASKSSDTLGFDNPIGLDHNDDRLYGGSATISPVVEDWGTLSLTASGYTGRGSSFGDLTVSEGDGYAAALRFSTLRDQLRFKAGFASTRFDADAEGSITESETGEAWNAGVDYEFIPSGDSDALEAPSLRLSFDYLRIGGQYRSLANPFIFPDHEDFRATLEYSKGPFSLTSEALYQTTDVEDEANLPTDRNIQLNIGGSYSLYQGETPPNWLGNATLSFGAQGNDFDRTELADSAFAIDAHVQSAQVFAGFDTSYQTWGWGINHTITRYDDRIYEEQDRTDYTTGLSGNWLASEKINLGAGFQWIHAETAGADSGDTLTSNLSADLIFIPDILVNSSRYSFTISNISGAFEGGELTSELNWTPLSGITLGLRGNVIHGDGIESDAEFDDLEGRLALILRISTPSDS